MNEPPTLAVFEFRPGKRKKQRRWLCFTCVAPTWREGKFHDPVIVQAADFAEVCCLICGKPVSNPLPGASSARA
jgi:hypothetical protein